MQSGVTVLAMSAIDLGSVTASADALFADEAAHGASLALVVMQAGQIVFERYGRQPDTVFGAGGPVTADSTLISWSMAKSITHAAVGILVGDGRLQLDAPAPVPSWRGTSTPASCAWLPGTMPMPPTTSTT